MAEENLAGIKIKNSYEGLLHLSDGGLNTSPGLWGYVKPVYDGQGRKTCLSLSSDVLAVSGTGGGIAIDSSGIGNPGFGDYGFIDQGKDGRGIGLRAADYQDGNKACDLYVGAGGNVGVGTEAPAAKLHVISPGTIAGNDLTQAAFLAGTVADGIGIDANEIRRNTGDFYIGTTNDNTTGTIRLNIGGTTALRIMSDGKVRYNYGTPVAGQVLKCTGSNGGMEWQDDSGQNTALFTNRTKGTVYQNTTGRKIIVVGHINGGNDIWSFACHAHPDQATVTAGTINLERTGGDRPSSVPLGNTSPPFTGARAESCKVYILQTSDNQYVDCASFSFVVPPNWYYKLIGNATVDRCEGWAI